MKKKKLIPTIALTLALVSAFTLGANASSMLQEIKAYLNTGITVKLDDKEQVLLDANGTRIFPITYNGSTYLPVRAVSNMLGIDVDWDPATQTVLLGSTPKGVDLINTYKAYSASHTTQYQTSDGKTGNIGGVDVDHWLFFDGYIGEAEAHFNLGGKYNEVTFQVYAKSKDTTLTVYGDNGTVLAEIPLAGDAVPKTVTIPLFNTTELYFYAKTSWCEVYIFDAKLS